MTESDCVMTAHPSDFKPGQKVWFFGLKAKVLQSADHEHFTEHIEDAKFDLWAVPILVKGAQGITIAHVDDLMPREKGEDWI